MKPMSIIETVTYYITHLGTFVQLLTVGYWTAIRNSTNLFAVT